jgi:ABC-type phosphate transport system substrate-binding protein
MRRVFLFVMLIFGVTAVAPTSGEAESPDSPWLKGAKSPDDILVIANRGVSVNSIGIEELRDIFLKRRGNWSGAEKVIPINPRDASLRNQFRAKVLGMSSVEEQAYWAKLKIQKGTAEPTEFGNPLKAVYKLDGAVSYVRRADYKDGIAKILLEL